VHETQAAPGMLVGCLSSRGTASTLQPAPIVALVEFRALWAAERTAPPSLHCTSPQSCVARFFECYWAWRPSPFLEIVQHQGYNIESRTGHRSEFHPSCCTSLGAPACCLVAEGVTVPPCRCTVSSRAQEQHTHARLAASLRDATFLGPAVQSPPRMAPSCTPPAASCTQTAVSSTALPCPRQRAGQQQPGLGGLRLRTAHNCD
jgi:hypothetical protein